ncbi:AraC family transcriptional activator of pyochelin receptor [Rhodopseudomonas rhenobacensis]|uniref:AraC family transcriptional activator of pyochelin receptor n=1 Tax=Rhodopseudomonas rhenobacensis TaxID=87461 RepID=A0A7W7Z8R4_9BRAD|nr:AraC family transcriptional regulator [Rhodopseudomonas rhenobacensis]MBB5049587.1 AraC family transcriptional activator of pyochelin receptor [Rhodopseudomonas rhenobacensis]
MTTEGVDLNERVIMMSGGFVMAVGINRFDQPKRVNTALPAGIKTVVLLSGHLQISVGGGRGREVRGPIVLLIRSSADADRDQVFAAHVPIRYLIVQMNEGVLGAELTDALDRSFAAIGGASHSGAQLASCPANRALQVLVSQITNCPIRGPERELYLCGKAMQLVALAISSCTTQASDADGRLAARDIERIRKARELLVASMRDAPSLDSLAQQVGLNVRKLSSGFRQVYGASVFGFLQEYRLEQAYKLISTDEMSVSEAAFHVGYGASHFTTIFRKRFGVSPSSLR